MTLDEIHALRQPGAHVATRDARTALARTRPDVALLQSGAVSVDDFLGGARAAVPYSGAALRPGLPGTALHCARVGLGSPSRALGEYRSSCRVREAALAGFPEAAELRALLATTRFKLGQTHAAVAGPLEPACDVSRDARPNDPARAIRFYAQDLDRRQG